MPLPELTLSRRTLLGAAIAVGVQPARLFAQPKDRLIAGTYRQEGGPGLVPMAQGPKGWTTGHPYVGIRNASFGVRAGGTGIRYLLDEQKQGALGVYGSDLQLLGTFSTMGADPCHAALSDEVGTLAVANYSSGNVAIWQLDRRTGLPVGEAKTVAHAGSGPDRERQAGPHAHWVGFAEGGTLIHAVDLGAEAIFAHAWDTRTGRLGKSAIVYRAEAGSGPRHLARHPRLPIAYLVAELANTVTILRAGPLGTFTAQGIVSTLPTGSHGSSAAAHIVSNRAGTRLYVSNRGHDSIAVFAIDARGGLELIQHASCGGHWPRLFLLLESRGELLVANERSGDIARLPLDAEGRLGHASRQVIVPGVAFLSR